MTTKAAILLITLGALNAGIAGVIVVTIVSQPNENEPQNVELRGEPERRDNPRPARVISGCAPCSRCRPVVIPVRAPASSCEITCEMLHREEVDRYRRMLADIQAWCNPYCQEQLDDCHRLVSTIYTDPNGIYRFDGD